MKKSKAKFEKIDSKLFKNLEKIELGSIIGGRLPIWTMEEYTCTGTGSGQPDGDGSGGKWD